MRNERTQLGIEVKNDKHSILWLELETYVKAKIKARCLKEKTRE